jgi:hypothetical protein
MFILDIVVQRMRLSSFPMADSSCSSAPRPSHPVTRKPFAIFEDARLIELVNHLGQASWDVIAAQMPGRSARQCRERWINYLSPDIRVGPWTEVEDYILLNQVVHLGTRWTAIARSLNGRSDSDVKNRWYSHLKDVSYQRPDGTWAIQRDGDGSIAFPKKKRRHNIVSPYAAAFNSLEQPPSPPDTSRFPRVRLPSLVLDPSGLFLAPWVPNVTEATH